MFEEETDYIYYVSLLKQYSEEEKVSVNAYCLMENHVHLLLRDTGDGPAQFMKKIGVSYAAYYNKKYDRTGHLFQDRYKSEPVETKEYLLTVFRYILNNPAAAGICPASEYLWSSYRKYDDPLSFVDSKPLCRLIGDWEHYAAYVSKKNCDQCMEYTSRKKDDEWAKETIKCVLGLNSGTALKDYEKSLRDEALRKLKQAGLSNRQIERLTGIGRSIVQKV
ncbi:MAG: transposase [Lachnospiraceae bacterium]|nr:transposase [Lachnospiraceae bacterium]